MIEGMTMSGHLSNIDEIHMQYIFNASKKIIPLKLKGKNLNSNQRATKHVLPRNILERAKLKFLFILCIWRNNIECRGAELWIN